MDCSAAMRCSLSTGRSSIECRHSFGVGIDEKVHWSRVRASVRIDNEAGRNCEFGEGDPQGPSDARIVDGGTSGG